MEEFVLHFTESEIITPIDIVSDITGLTYEEIRSCSEILKIDVDKEAEEILNMTVIDRDITQAPYTI